MINDFITVKINLIAWKITYKKNNTKAPGSQAPSFPNNLSR